MIRFDVKDFRLTLNEQTLMVYEFDQIVQYDKSADKKQALQDLLYVYCMYDEESMYKDFTEAQKERAVKQNVYRNGEYQIPPDRQLLIDAAVEEYARLNNTAERRLLEVMQRKIDALTEYLDKIKITNEDEFKLVSNSMGQLEKLLTSKRNAEQILEQGLKKAKSRVKGGAERSPMEKGQLNYSQFAKKK